MDDLRRSGLAVALLLWGYGGILDLGQAGVFELEEESWSFGGPVAQD